MWVKLFMAFFFTIYCLRLSSKFRSKINEIIHLFITGLRHGHSHTLFSQTYPKSLVFHCGRKPEHAGNEYHASSHFYLI